MNAINFLESQHREVEALFEQIEATKDKSGAGAERKSLLAEINEKLTYHAKIEEKLLYPAGRPVDEDMTLEAYEEHDIVKSLLRKLSRTRTNDEAFMARITVLKEIVEHHVEEEEEAYFPKLQKELGEEKLEKLGDKLELAFERLQGGRGHSVHREKTDEQESAAA